MWVVCAGHNDAADVAGSLAARQLQSCPKPDTIADGLRGALGCAQSVSDTDAQQMAYRIRHDTALVVKPPFSVCRAHAAA